MSNDLTARINELERIVANMMRVGVVTALDEANAAVKMNVNGLETDWMPFPAARAGATRTWSAPRIGEQMMVLAPHGDSGQAVAGQSIYQDDHPAPATSKDQEHTIYPDGTTVDYNSATNTYTATLAGDAKWIINCKAATINAVDTAIVNTKACTVNAEDTATVNTEVAAVNASTSLTVDSPTSTFTGAVIVQGPFSYQAGMSGTGGSGAVLTGDFRAQSGVFQHNSKNVGSTHTHTGVDPGGGTSGAPS